MPGFPEKPLGGVKPTCKPYVARMSSLNPLPLQGEALTLEDA